MIDMSGTGGPVTEEMTEEIKNRRKEDSKMNQFAHSVEITWINFVNSFKKHLSLMIIFVLLGGACGIYISKIVYDFRMKEITMIGGLVFNGEIFDVKKRP
jgi:hypothetical protein